MRRGRKVGNVSAVAEVIFSRVGMEFPIKNQLQLRKAARVGSYHLTLLRREPQKVSKEILLRLADVVKLPAEKILRMAGHECTDEEIVAMRQKMRRQQRSQLDTRNVNFSVHDFQLLMKLEKLIQGPVPLNLAVLFLAARRANTKKD